MLYTCVYYVFNFNVVITDLCSGSVPASTPIKLSHGKRYCLLHYYNASIYETTLKHV